MKVEEHEVAVGSGVRTRYASANRAAAPRASNQRSKTLLYPNSTN